MIINNETRFPTLKRLLGVAIVLMLYGWSVPAAAGANTEAFDPEPVVRNEGNVMARVFFATNRAILPDREGADRMGPGRGEPLFGRCGAEFTPIPVVGELASRIPFFVPTESRSVNALELLDGEVFWKELAAAAAGTTSGSVVLYVHGYNYGFERTCLMAAELQRRLENKATLLMFSWPSNGNPADYVADQADMEWSVPFLTDVLSRLVDRVGGTNFSVLAHSLGSRGVILSLYRLGVLRHDRPLVGELVFLAPDFDSQVFVTLLPELRPLSDRITLYASSGDAPLKLSQQLSGYPRLGQAGEYLTVAPGMETIDVSAAGRYQFTGHEYFYYHPLVAADLETLLSERAGAAQRPGLRPLERDGQVYWQISANGSR
jgi:pimeloyl-ACP methyl ester carboxylesterase